MNLTHNDKRAFSMIVIIATLGVAIFLIVMAVRPAPAADRVHEKYCTWSKCDEGALSREDYNACYNECMAESKPVAFRPWQEVWQCNDLRVTVSSPRDGIINYDIAGSIWGGINFTMDGPRHQLYKGQWPCVWIR